MTGSVATTIQFARESIASCWAEAFPLMLKHHSEVGILHQSRFRPSKDFYLNLEGAGVLEVFTMRDDGKLCGYAVFTVMPVHPHYPDALWAREDSIYVLPKHRGPSAIGFQAFQYRELRRKHEGVEIICHSTPRCDRSKTLERFGFREMETAWILDREEIRL